MPFSPIRSFSFSVPVSLLNEVSLFHIISLISVSFKTAFAVIAFLFLDKSASHAQLRALQALLLVSKAATAGFRKNAGQKIPTGIKSLILTSSVKCYAAFFASLPLPMNLFKVNDNAQISRIVTIKPTHGEPIAPQMI